MKNRNMINRLKRLLILGMATSLLMSFDVRATEIQPVDLYEYVEEEFVYEYVPSASFGDDVVTKTLTSGLIYNDGMLLTNANIESKDLAKVSVSLSMAAYDQGEINSLLSSMGYNLMDNSRVYARESTMTLSDNDYVAYTIATKEIEYNGETYLVYCVPVKGTSKNAAWYSNFNVGDDGTHDGYEKAASEVKEMLSTCFENDGYSAQNRIVWLTGHSRGAAVANLVSGWLSDNKDENFYASREHIFGYTFGCPAVSHDASSTMTNIYNYNYAGDFMTLFPNSGTVTKIYKRYGVDIILSADNTEDKELIENIKLQYKTFTGEEYEAATTSETYQNMLNEIIKDNSDYTKSENKLLFQLLAHYLGGYTQTSIEDVIKTSGPDILFLIIKEKSPVIADVIKATSDVIDNCDRLMQFIIDKQTEAKNMTAQDFVQFLVDYKPQIEKIKEITGITVESVSDLDVAYNRLEECWKQADKIGKAYNFVQAVLFDVDGTFRNGMIKGHSQPTYVTWINAEYYGFHGWYGNDNISGNVVIDDEYNNIGAGCFNWCDNITSVEISDNVRYLGSQAFGNCDNIKEVTVPIDCNYADNVFYSSNGVETIHYTYGQTGVMSDRTEENYNNSLEHYSYGTLKNIDFEEGITRIGDYAFYRVSDDYGKALTNVSLPSTLTSIGEKAFAHQVNLAELELPEGLEEIEDSAFYGAKSLDNIMIPDSVTRLGDYSFYDCFSLSEITIPDCVDYLGASAFGNCDALEKVTVPVDYDFTTMPFYSCNGVKSIIYTPGKTGKMQDRTKDNYSRTLEHYSYSMLKDIEFQEGITEIGGYAFYNISDTYPGVLVNISLSSTLTRIGAYAFAYQSKLDTVNLPVGLKEIGAGAFSDCPLLKSVQLPEGLTAIEDYTFLRCKGLENVVIPNTVKRLGTSAFGECTSLKEITLPVTHDYSYGPFYMCRNVEVIHYTKGTTGILPDRLKDYREKMLETIAGNKIKKITFGEGITKLGTWAFYDLNGITEIYIPKGITEIGNYAFNSWDGLVTTYYCGTQEEWDAVTLGTNNEILNNTLSLHKWKDLDTVDSTCSEQGYEGKKCELCGQEEIEKLPLKEHGYSEVWSIDEENHWYECTCGDKKELASHSFEWKTDKAATEAEAGLMHEECAVCGYKRNENTVIEKLPHTHIMKKTQAVEKTCEEDGNVEYYTCEKCGKYYRDEAGTAEIKLEDTVVPAEGHDFEWIIDKAATETESGLKHEECAVCRYKRNENTVIEKLPQENVKDPMSFVDVRENDWFYSSVEFVFDNKLMTGMTQNTFGPAINLSRAQFAVILWRMNGSPVMDYKATFPDVPAGTWYTDAVLWANQKGIITGYSHNGHFGSADNITREQMALMMFRYGNFKGFDVSQRADFGAFKDATSVSGFASEAMKWTVANGIITGKQNGTALEPQGNASRAECATIIMRFMNTYE